MKNETCCNNAKEITPRILSQAATDELLGEELNILFLVTKKGKILRYYPHGFDESTLKSLNNDSATTSLVIKTRIPKLDCVPEGNFKNKFLAFFRACPCCQCGGQCTDCD
jgi:hypothetical protein